MYTFFKKTIVALIIASFFVVAVPPKAEAAIDVASIGGAGAGALVGCLNLSSKIAGLGTKATKKALGKLDDSVATKDKNQAEANTRASCGNQIAAAVAKVTLSQLTESIVNWINTGFNGNPLYIKNYESFFASIENDSINTLKSGILKGLDENPNLSPYLKSSLKNLVNDHKATLASYGLTYKYTGPDVKQFQQDFKTGGGWTAWKSMTLSQRNNPLGVNIKLGEESKRLIEQKTGAIQAELTQPNFLSVKKCVDPIGYDVAHKTDPTLVCERWETVTPGSVVQAQLNQALGTTGRQLELTEDINQSVSKIFTALVDQLMKKGLSSLTHQKADDNYTFGGPGINKSVDGISQFKNGDPSDWLNVAPGKPIDPRVFAHEILPDTFITQLSYIGDQATLDQYKNKKATNQKDLLAPSLKRRIVQLNTANPGSGDVNHSSNLKKYSETISELTNEWCGGPFYDLSYCIPGPRPGFQDNNTDGIIEMKVANAHNVLDSSFNISGWQGFWKGIDTQQAKNSMMQSLRTYYRDAFDIYTRFISQTYINNPDVMPITKIANSELEKWPQYDQQILDNADEESDVRSLAYQVYSIQVKMDDLMNRVYKRLSDESKSKFGYDPKRREQVGNINELPIDPACLSQVVPFGGLYGTTGTNANGTLIGGTNPAGTATGYTSGQSGSGTATGFSGGSTGSGSNTGKANGQSGSGGGGN